MVENAIATAATKETGFFMARRLAVRRRRGYAPSGYRAVALVNGVQL